MAPGWLLDSVRLRVSRTPSRIRGPLYAGGRIVNGNRLAALGVEVVRESAGMARRDYWLRRSAYLRAVGELSCPRWLALCVERMRKD